MPIMKLNKPKPMWMQLNSEIDVPLSNRPSMERLKINIHEGETLDPNKTAMILGNIDELYLRVSIDQLDYNVSPQARPTVPSQKIATPCRILVMSVSNRANARIPPPNPPLNKKPNN